MPTASCGGQTTRMPEGDNKRSQVGAYKMSYSGRCVIGSAIVILVIGVGAGIAIGYFLIPGKNDSEEKKTETEPTSPAGKRYQEQCRKGLELSRTCNAPLPRQYIVTRLSGNISIDGRLDDEAWENVPWTEKFVDIRGAPPAFPAPSLDTRVKVIYDDTHIYVATKMTENQVWATYTQKDSRIYEENAFEIFFDVENSMSWYKEFEINALGTTWDLALSRAYIDGGNFTDWEGIGQKGVYTDGGVNDINKPSTFWSVEVSFPFSALNENTSRSHLTPVDGEVWFTIFARPQYQTRPNQNTGQYEKVPDSKKSSWSWNPIGAVNLHLPSRWGLLYFTNQTAQEVQQHQTQMTFPDWNVYHGLFHIFDTMQAYKAVNGMFVTDENQVHFDPYIKDCFAVSEVLLTDDGFEARLATSSSTPTVTGHIDQNRHVWFTS